MIERTALKAEIELALTRFRVVELVGPRQSGKTTLAREFVPFDALNYFDLENPLHLARLDQPMTALQDLRGLVVIDEVQRRPDLFPILRVLADRAPLPARFLVLGSAAPEWLQQSSQSLAGRLQILPVSGFNLAEVGSDNLMRHWLRGAFPLAYLADDDNSSFAWRQAFTQSIIERDLPLLGANTAAPLMQRFWMMLAHYHGGVWSAAEIGRGLQIKDAVARRYLDTLEGVFMVRQLQPWYENISKRQIKSPKIYIRDSGLLHTLLGIRRDVELATHPKVGASWEGYVIEEVLRAVRPDQAYFWATHGGAELDLLLFKDGKRIGVECKRVDAPRLTPSMQSALADLHLDHLFVIYPGALRFPLAERVEAFPLRDLTMPGALLRQ